jgi:hypothetical protein
MASVAIGTGPTGVEELDREDGAAAPIFKRKPLLFKRKRLKPDGLDGQAETANEYGSL